MVADMDRSEIVLAALAAGGEGAMFTPVQVQKLFFIIDRELGPRVDGPHFAFVPYDYGPFDGAVYRELEALRHRGMVHIDAAGSVKHYSLTPEGLAPGGRTLGRLDANVRQYLDRVARWIRSLGFGALVSAIYTKYPEMKANSVFRE
jgi:hypothetical protein